MTTAEDATHDQDHPRRHRRIGHLRSAGARSGARRALRLPLGRALGGRCASARSPDCRWSSCSRHDRGHRLSPSDINYRANIDVLKRAGVTDLVSLSACGSFKEELPPGTFVLVDQFVDRTHRRESSFFGKGCVAHVSMAHPVSPRLRLHLAAAAEAEGITVARGGTYVCMEGPQFSTLAESLTYKQPGLCGDRHDQHAGSQARPRGGDLLRDRRHGDGLRLLASRPRRRHGAGHHQGAHRSMPTRPSAWSPAWPGIFRASTSPARSAPTARSTAR